MRVDVTLAHDFLNLPLRPTLAIDVVNLFDAQYAYRLFNGFNGSHWAPGRSVYLRGSVHFLIAIARIGAPGRGGSARAEVG